LSLISTWVEVARAPFLIVAALPFVFGSALGYSEAGKCDIYNLVVGAVALILVHVGANMLNEYYDYKSGVDGAAPKRSPFSGGSRVIQRGLLQGKSVFRGAIGVLVIVVVLGVTVAARSNFALIMAIGVAGCLIAWTYTAPPVKLIYRGFGEVAVGIAFGPLIVVGGYVTQTGHFGIAPLICSIPIAIATAMILFINEFPDIEPDAQYGKRTLAVRLGVKKATIAYGWLAGAFVVSSLIITVTGVLGGVAYIGVLLSGFLLYIAAKKLRESPENACSVSAVLTLLTHHLACVIFTVAAFLK